MGGGNVMYMMHKYHCLGGSHANYLLEIVLKLKETRMFLCALLSNTDIP